MLRPNVNAMLCDKLKSPEERNASKLAWFQVEPVTEALKFGSVSLTDCQLNPVIEAARALGFDLHRSHYVTLSYEKR